MRTPVAPTGWPSEIPEPLTLWRGSSLAMFQDFRQAMACAAKASFSSVRSILPNDRPARHNAFSTVGTGPILMRSGRTPDTPQLTGLPRGFSPISSALSRVVTIQAAAASFWPLAPQGGTGVGRVQRRADHPWRGVRNARVMKSATLRLSRMRSPTVGAARHPSVWVMPSRRDSRRIPGWQGHAERVQRKLVRRTWLTNALKPTRLTDIEKVTSMRRMAKGAGWDDDFPMKLPFRRR